MQTATTTARVYVGTYHKYASDSIAGAWLDLENYSNRSEFFEACAELHKDEVEPECMFQDWEGVPAGMIGESYIESEVWAWLELDDDDKELLAVIQHNIDESGDIERAREEFRGKYDSAADFACEYYEEAGVLKEVPSELQCHIDWESVARDMSAGSIAFVQHEGYTFVFSN